MYGLPSDFNGQVFVGRMLQSIVVRSNQLVFEFDSDCWIQLESSYSHSERNERSGARIRNVPHFDPKLMRVVDQCVSLALAEANGTFRLTFENGDSLVVYDPDPRYEAYAIGWGSGDLRV
jgi:hypothetical protein